MRGPFPKSVLRALPALALAVFLGAQFGLVDHLHADDGFVGDCLQCQFDQGHAAVCAGPAAPDAPAVEEVSGGILPVASILPRYRLNARGPPKFS